jgi:pilus assembly protein CpaB
MKTRIIAVAAAAGLALAGAIALVFAVQGAGQVAAAGKDTRPVLVVTAEIPAGTSADRLESAVSLENVPGAYVAEDAVADLDDLDGLITAVGLKPGEQVLASRFVTPAELASSGGRADVPEGMQEVSIALDIQRVAGGSVGPGDRVGVFASLPASGVEAASTRLLLDQVLVTAVASTVDQDEEGGSAQGLVLVTLAVSADDAQRLVYAAEFGTVWLSAQNAESTPVTGGAATRPAATQGSAAQ